MSLRVYEKDTPQYFFYKEMHENQTLEFVKKKKEQYFSYYLINLLFYKYYFIYYYII